MSTPRVGVVGASARAAVHSLARAGHEAWAVDLFADRDLKRVAPCVVCAADSFPEAIPELAKQFPEGPVLYTGGLENHPRVVAELATNRALWDNAPELLERVRDPHRLLTSLAGRSLPALAPPAAPAPTTGRWLRKPLRSSSGHGIRFAQPGEGPSSSHYFQEYIDGVPMSAVFRNESLFGITEQLIGEPWLHAKPFGYCGNIGPVEAPREMRAEVFLIGLIMTKAFGLRGVWGLDFIARNDQPFPVEINPRYTASLEVLEHGLRGAALWSHAYTFTDPTPDRLKTPRAIHVNVGKAIYFAAHGISFPARGPWDADLVGEFDPWRIPTFADIPEPGTAIEAGWPVLTVFARGSSPAECRERLQSRAAELDHLFAEAET